MRPSKSTSKMRIIILKVNDKHTLEVYRLNLNYFPGFTVTALPCCKAMRVEHSMILLYF